MEPLLIRKTLEVSRGYTYTYYTTPATANKPTLLLLHGWPDSAELWTDLATKYLQPAGYGLIIPDCLGYAGTSKPTDVEAYAWSGMTQDLVEILDKEKVDKVFSAGHDWGSTFAQRFWIFHPERCCGLAMINVAYRGKPPGPTNLDNLRDSVTAAIGYFGFWFWYLLSSPDGALILDAHLPSLFDAIHGDPESWMETMCVEDGLKDWLMQDKTQPRASYATEAMKRDFILQMRGDGFAAPLCWYRATMGGVQYHAEKDIPPERYMVNVPSLFVGGKLDKACVPAAIRQPVEQGLLPSLTIEELDAGHWSLLAKPKETGELFLRWLENSS
jgi:soluble epoxide hydrolase/lipid-phosphate phosphatase